MRNAQLLILDEPTSALDPQAEYEVFAPFRELTVGKSAVFISHRFSTVRLANRIIVLEAGSVLEEGTHDELLARGGRYAELLSLQADATGERPADTVRLAPHLLCSGGRCRRRNCDAHPSWLQRRRV